MYNPSKSKNLNYKTLLNFIPVADIESLCKPIRNASLSKMKKLKQLSENLLVCESS